MKAWSRQSALHAGAADLVVFRDADLNVMKQPVEAAALAVLLEFRESASLMEAFGNLEGRLSGGRSGGAGSRRFRLVPGVGGQGLAMPAERKDGPAAS